MPKRANINFRSEGDFHQANDSGRKDYLPFIQCHGPNPDRKREEYQSQISIV